MKKILCPTCKSLIGKTDGEKLITTKDREHRVVILGTEYAVILTCIGRGCDTDVNVNIKDGKLITKNLVLEDESETPPPAEPGKKPETPPAE
jgi:hypothetical protein